MNVLEIEINKDSIVHFKPYEPNALYELTYHRDRRKIISLYIDHGEEKGAMEEYTLPIMDLDIRSMSNTTLKRSSFTDDDWEANYKWIEKPVKCVFSCIASHRTWSVSVCSNHPQFDKIRDFLTSLM